MINPKYHRDDLLRKAFDENEFSLRTLAAASGVAINTIRAALEGDHIQSDKLKLIADTLGVAWVELHDINFEIVERHSIQIHN